MMVRETFEKKTILEWGLLFQEVKWKKGGRKRRAILGCEIGTRRRGIKEHDVLGNSEKLAGIDIPQLMDTSRCKPVMEIFLSFAREKDGVGGSIIKAGWSQIVSYLQCQGHWMLKTTESHR